VKLRNIADKRIKEQQIGIYQWVGDVQIVGGREREIEIWVDPDSSDLSTLQLRR